MKTRALLGFAALSLACSGCSFGAGITGLAGASSLASTASNSSPSPGWELTFADDFSADAIINQSFWSFAYFWSPVVINIEQEYYAPSAVSLTAAGLRIQATQQSLGGQPYASGVISTKNAFSQAFGYFEMKTRIPHGQGLWPAFWIESQDPNNPVGGEVDIFENLGQKPDTYYTTLHCTPMATAAGQAGNQGVTQSASLADGGFHTFGLQWIPGSVIWYIDAVEVYRLQSECVPSAPEYILANLAVGGNWPGNADATTPFPANMDIAYIHAYRQVANGGISLPGPGAGIPFAPPPPASPPAVGLSHIMAAPASVAAQGAIHLSGNLIAGNQPLANVIFGYRVFDINNNNVVSLDTANLSIPANGSQAVAEDLLLPASMGPGLYRVAVGVWSSGYAQSLYWENDDAQFVINP
jgi:beta-glucanase (GH16 family)